MALAAQECGWGPWRNARYTQRVEIGVVSYNPNYGLISLVTVNFFLNRHCIGVVWLSSLLFLFISEVRELTGIIRLAKYGVPTRDYLNFWNAVDWVSIICAYVVIGTYVRLITETGATTDTMSSYIAQDQQNLTTLQSEASEKVFDAVESVVLAEADFRFALMFCPIVTWLMGQFLGSDRKFPGRFPYDSVVFPAMGHI